MDNQKFQEESLSKISNLERDVAFIKGVIEGRDYKKVSNRDKLSISLSFLSLGVSIVLVLSRILGW